MTAKPTYVVVIRPAEGAPLGSVIAERKAEGPFDDVDQAVAYAQRRQRTIGQLWHADVVRIVEPLRSIVREIAS